MTDRSDTFDSGGLLLPDPVIRSPTPRGHANRDLVKRLSMEAMLDGPDPLTLHGIGLGGCTDRAALAA